MYGVQNTDEHEHVGHVSCVLQNRSMEGVVSLVGAECRKGAVVASGMCQNLGRERNPVAAAG